MSKTTKSKPLNVQLAKRLRAISGTVWYCYEVDNKLFGTLEKAKQYAIKLAALRGESVWLTKVKVPSALPRKFVTGYTGEYLGGREKMPDVTVYFVGSQAYTSLEQAKQAAMVDAHFKYEWLPIMSATIAAKDMDFVVNISPGELKASEVKAAEPETVTAAGGAA